MTVRVDDKPPLDLAQALAQLGLSVFLSCTRRGWQLDAE